MKGVSFYHPVSKKIKFITDEKWFTKKDEFDSSRLPVIIPDILANSLGILPDMVNSNNDIEITIHNLECVVIGIFSSDSYDSIIDIDGSKILPYNIELMTDVKMTNETRSILYNGEIPLISSSKIVTLPIRNNLKIPLKRSSKIE